MTHPVRPLHMSMHNLRSCLVFHHQHAAFESRLIAVTTARPVTRCLQDITGLTIVKIVRELHDPQEGTINSTATDFCMLHKTRKALLAGTTILRIQSAYETGFSSQREPS